MSTDNQQAEQLARLFHDTYERLAPQYGYETRDDTKQFDSTTPNGRLMIAVCGVVIDWHNKQIEEVLDRLESERDSHDADTGCSDELGYIPLSAIQAERIKLQAGGDWQGIAILTAMKLKEK